MAIVDALVAVDRAIGGWVQANAGPGITAFMAGVSGLHGPRSIVAATFAIALVLLWRRRFLDAATVLVTVLGGATLNHLVKHSVQRARPDTPIDWTGTTDYSFPSGHVANSTLLYGVAAALLLARVTDLGWRIAIVACAVLAVTTVAASRLVLGAHHASDVLAGALLGMGWLALCLAVVRRAATS
ncbi:MAG TPA: phosphatase PAP2 family protein [Albitalea sp.]|uniref:phosphatase PAP2 family protein n=1 Tax=Piscinibacter sp. TaxID=1903157 RepID=UPI002ED5C73A